MAALVQSREGEGSTFTVSIPTGSDHLDRDRIVAPRPIVSRATGALSFDSRFASARLIAVTGYGQESDRRRALESGFDEHLVKPVALERLQGLLREH
jgi:CheY-like chemotaxis protein